MAENEKDVPIKEQEDGSFVAKVDLPEEIQEGEQPETKKKKEEDHEDHEDHDDEEGDEEAASEGETEEDREAIREARREERRLKKELKKQRDLTAKNKITALERRNAELAERLAKLKVQLHLINLLNWTKLSKTKLPELNTLR